MPLPLIETPRLIIRDVQTVDVDGFFEYMQREQYWRDVPIEQPTVQSITALVNGGLQDQAKQPRTDYFLAAVEKHSQSVVGEAILHVRSLRWRQGEIGWGVGFTRTGQGLARRSIYGHLMVLPKDLRELNVRVRTGCGDAVSRCS